MKKTEFPFPDAEHTPDADRTVTQCVETEEGVEQANVNLATGEVTYTQSDGTCRQPETTFGKLVPNK